MPLHDRDHDTAINARPKRTERYRSIHILLVHLNQSVGAWAPLIQDLNTQSVGQIVRIRICLCDDLGFQP